MDDCIQATNLTKIFPGGTVGVSALDLRVPQGSIYGLIGRNGSGKTTTLRLLMGLLRVDQGSSAILGYDMWQAPQEVRQQVAYVSQVLQAPGWMSLKELCRYLSHFYDRWDGARAQTLRQLWDIDPNRPIGHLSGGQQRQVGLLTALAARPRVLILDEPAGGMDAIARRQLLSVVVDAAGDPSDGGATVLISSHQIGDLERIAEHVAIMDRGRVTRAERLESLLETTKRVQVVFDRTDVPAGFEIPGASRTEIVGPVARGIVELTSPSQFDELRAMDGVRVHVFPLNLEEIFIESFSPPSLSETESESVQDPT